MGKFGKKFTLEENSPVVQATDQILSPSPAKQEQDSLAQPIPQANQQMQTAAQPNSLADDGRAGAGLKPKKTENGIVINVPMADYMQLTMMKLQTGRTLKDLALQAIHEFVERNRVG